MSILRRVTTLVTALLLLHQLTLVGGTAACGAHVRGTDGALLHHRGMSMDGAHAGASHSAVESNAASRQLGGNGEWQAATPGGSGCPAHGTTTRCDSMAACAPVVLSATITSVSILPAPAARTTSSRVLAPPTRTTAPELPPPRA